MDAYRSFLSSFNLIYFSWILHLIHSIVNIIMLLEHKPWFCAIKSVFNGCQPSYALISPLYRDVDAYDMSVKIAKHTHDAKACFSGEFGLLRFFSVLVYLSWQLFRLIYYLEMRSICSFSKKLMRLLCTIFTMILGKSLWLLCATM